MNRAVLLIAIAFFGLLFTGCESRSGERKPAAAGVAHRTDRYLVTKVVDGDTFWVDNGSPKGLKIRLIGVDAPVLAP
jgi:micrococcal nuclease